MKTKVKILATIFVILLATLLMSTSSLGAVSIILPMQLINGRGTIVVSGNTENDKIYYQSIVMTDEQYQKLNSYIERIQTEQNDFTAKFDAKNRIYTELAKKVNNQTATQEEINLARELYTELLEMKEEQEEEQKKLISNLEAFYPRYNNDNWIEAVDGKVEITNKTAEDKYYVLWAKVGDTVDKLVYKVSAMADPEIPKKDIKVEVGKTLELTGIEGTDLSTITWTSDDPTIATITNNKVNGLKIGATIIRGKKDGKEVIDIYVTVKSENSTKPTTDIPDDAKTYNGHTYYYFSGNKSWDDAKAYCEKIGGHLVTITTKDESDFIKTLNSTHKAWIGGYRTSGTSTDWKWVTNEAWNYTDWNTNEPSSKSNENRAVVLPTKWGALNNNSTEVAGFICEWDEAKSDDGGKSGSNQTDPKNQDPENQKPNEEVIYSQKGTSQTTPKSTSGDQSIANKKIPQTGESMVAIIALVAVAGVSVIIFVNYRKNNK